MAPVVPDEHALVAVDARVADDEIEVAVIVDAGEEAGIDVDADALLPFAHWVTPDDETRRSDTWFYVTVGPATQIAMHDGVENTDSVWIDPAAALDACARGEIALPPPARMTLRRLAMFETTDAVLAWARGVRIERVQPTIEVRHGVKRLTVPGEPPTRFVMERGRWVAADA